MIYKKYLFYFILLQFIENTKHETMHMHFTKVLTHDKNHNGLRYHCLYADIKSFNPKLAWWYHSNVPYCISKSLTELEIQPNDLFSRFTFLELFEQNIASDELYLWNAPIDLIEDYQFYLNQLSTSNDLSLAKYVFYNCSWPRFGPMCQYQYDYSYGNPTMTQTDYLDSQFYWDKRSLFDSPCYIHLPCNHSNIIKCLDWTDICDGKVDCLNGGIDEEHCFQLEMNQCKDDEYRCYNGLCVSKSFFGTRSNVMMFDCLHPNEQLKLDATIYNKCKNDRKFLSCDEKVCFNTFLTSSCLKKSSDFITMLYSIKEKHILNDCWSAFKCLLEIQDTTCNHFNQSQSEYILIIEQTCPNMMFIPSVPILFDDIYFAYIKNRSWNANDNHYLYFYLCTNNTIYDDYFIHNQEKIIMNKTICYRNNNLRFNLFDKNIEDLFLYQHNPLSKFNRFMNYSSIVCNQPNMYQCMNSSKCISKYRFMDDIYDCPYLDDENEKLTKNIGLLKNSGSKRFKCPNAKLYILPWWIDDLYCDCGYNDNGTCDDGEIISENDLSSFTFWTLCDKSIDLSPILINDRNETDETNCDYWPCNNHHTRCNKILDCVNGEDEDICDDSRFMEEENQHEQSTYLLKSSNHHHQAMYTSLIDNEYQLYSSDSYRPYCHRGTNLRVWLDDNNNISTTACLCPPNYYGDQCQYQNQRVNLYIQFDLTYNSAYTLLIVVISLIDDSDERLIHSYDRFTLRTDFTCAADRYHFTTLIYASRPKNELKTYAIHVDIYEKMSLGYRGSFLIPISFSFMPVHNVIQSLIIPRSNYSAFDCSFRRCKHGKCVKYVHNSDDAKFCQCYKGWSGKYCNICHNSMCSLDSIYVGLSVYQQSVCVCPVNRTGPRCLITDLSCVYKTPRCHGNGQCVSHDEIEYSGSKYSCSCYKGFHDDKCQSVAHTISLFYGNDIIIPLSIYIHFFDFVNDVKSKRTTITKRIIRRKNSTVIYWLDNFELIAAQFSRTGDYYLISRNFRKLRSLKINKTITTHDRCPHLNEIVDKTVLNLHQYSRTKYYHLICQTYPSRLNCFYDEFHFCLCYNHTQQIDAICLNHNNMNPIWNCPDKNYCNDKGQCQLGGNTCEKNVWCLCNKCFFGRQCQFHTSGFGLSIDIILGPFIEPQTNLLQQPPIVQLSMILSIVFILVGFIDGIVSLMTFKNKAILDVGCGFYLLISSIITLLIATVFGLKIWILILAQISLIENQLFLLIHCYSIDFILRTCLYTDQWLHACVAIERAICTAQGIRFSKIKSKQIAKLVIIFLIIFNIGTSIHDPFYRYMIDDDNDFNDVDDNIKRSWCVVKYPSNFLSTYNNIVHTCHFFIPFLLNIISASILIIQKARLQLNVQHHQSFLELFQEQFQKHKHLFTAPIILVILATSRLILTYTTECLESEGDVWLYLLLYFISIIPSILTFIIFILPSKYYKRELGKTFQQYQRDIRRRFQFVM